MCGSVRLSWIRQTAQTRTADLGPDERDRDRHTRVAVEQRMGSGESANPRQAFADDLPRRDLNPSEAKVLSMAIKPELGTKFCSTWDITDFNGEPITIGLSPCAAGEPG